MKANELRIGNIAQGNAIQADKSGIGAVEFTGQIFSISSVEPRIRINIDKLGLLYASDCMLSGVPLTEEILVKLGFYLDELRGKYRMQISQEMELFFDDSFGVYLYEDFTCCEIFMKSFCYVHELQNLYFALTGEELNVSEILK